MTPRIRVEGTPYERGRQYGAQARTQVHRSVQAYQRVFAHYAGWDWPAVRRAAVEFEAPIADFRPAYLDEMRGIADGAGLDLADVLAINVRTEVMFAAKARQAPLAARQAPLAARQAPLAARQAPLAARGPANSGANSRVNSRADSQANSRQLPAECSAFAAVPTRGASRTATLIGQNWDWLLHSAQTLVVLEVRQEDGPDFVTVVEAGLLAKAGLNAAGLGLVTNALVTDADTGTPGLPYHVLLRAILDCATVTEALEVLQAGMRSSSANYLIAHASGAALDVEAAPGDFTRLYTQLPDHGLLLHSNHFLSPRLQPVDVSLWAMPSSAVRLQRLRAGAAEPATLDDFRTLLADHADYPHSICSHPDPDDHPLEQGATIASVLMDLNTRRLWLAAGNPCQTPYTELDLGWLGVPAPAGAAL